VDEWLKIATEYCVTLIDAMALIVIVVGTVEAFLRALWAFPLPPDEHRSRRTWLRFARWLVAGLTFQLAADIIETATRPSWGDIGQLAAIAVIRTFLNYFLDRDLADIEERQAGARDEPAKT
jgi:uncharacterized membrane protein